MTKSFTFKNLSKVINKNKYLNKIRKTTKQDNTSLAYLLKTYKITQRESIRIGYFIEKLLIDIILNETNLINIKESNRKGQKETDHLFFDSNTNTIYYDENIDLKNPTFSMVQFLLFKALSILLNLTFINVVSPAIRITTINEYINLDFIEYPFLIEVISFILY